MNAKPRILFVEDDPAILSTFVVGLEAEGYPVVAVSSTEEALTKLANDEFALHYDRLTNQRSGNWPYFMPDFRGSNAVFSRCQLSSLLAAGHRQLAG